MNVAGALAGYALMIATRTTIRGLSGTRLGRRMAASTKAQS
ncbi:MAG TPA: hypothetical protein VJ979_07425 [Actinomycetota bacterium]|nr:hypothetical protein [Actinomycetota bacterium]